MISLQLHDRQDVLDRPEECINRECSLGILNSVVNPEIPTHWLARISETGTKFPEARISRSRIQANRTELAM